MSEIERAKGEQRDREELERSATELSVIAATARVKQNHERYIACVTGIKLIRAELEREKNEPLTVEEILNMNGKPVWCQTGDGYEGWALVIVDKYQDGGHYLYLFSDDLTRDGINECFEPDEDFINLKFSDDPDGHFGLHVLGWRAYRYEPKGEPNV